MPACLIEPKLKCTVTSIAFFNQLSLFLCIKSINCSNLCTIRPWDYHTDTHTQVKHSGNILNKSTNHNQWVSESKRSLTLGYKRCFQQATAWIEYPRVHSTKSLFSFIHSPFIIHRTMLLWVNAVKWKHTLYQTWIQVTQLAHVFLCSTCFLQLWGSRPLWCRLRAESRRSERLWLCYAC